jgi:protein-disulfide isomerase
MAKKKPQDKAAAQARRTARRERTERARAQAAQRRRAEQRKQRLVTAGLVVGVLVLIGGGFLVVRSLDSGQDATPPAGATDDYGLRLGEEDAPRSVVIYEDFLCPFCSQLEQTVADPLDAQVEAGEVSVEYRPVAFLERISDYSPAAANAFAVVLDASGPEVARDYHHLLFEQQPAESGPFPSPDDLVELAVEAGAEEADVREGIESGAFEGWVEAASEAASREGVTGTPTVLVDGEPVEGQTLGEIADAMLGGAG